jgi:hypothetical protein
MFILLAAAVVVVCVPLACFVLVCLASLREDGAHSLGHQPAGRMQAAARRLLGFYGSGIDGGARTRFGAASTRIGDGFGDGGIYGDEGYGLDGASHHGASHHGANHHGANDHGAGYHGGYPPEPAGVGSRPDLRDLVG